VSAVKVPKNGTTWRDRSNPTHLRVVIAQVERDGTTYLWTQGLFCVPALSTFTAARFVELFEAVR